MLIRPETQPTAHRGARTRGLRRTASRVLRWWALASRAALVAAVGVILLTAAVHDHRSVTHVTFEPPSVSRTAR